MLRIWLKRFGKMLSKHYMGILLVAALISSYALVIVTMFDTAYWKYLATVLEPECCAICEDGNGNRYHAPVLVNLSTGAMRELEIYDRDPRRPWEIAEEQRWDD